MSLFSRTGPKRMSCTSQRARQQLHDALLRVKMYKQIHTTHTQTQLFVAVKCLKYTSRDANDWKGPVWDVDINAFNVSNALLYNLFDDWIDTFCDNLCWLEAANFAQNCATFGIKHVGFHVFEHCILWHMLWPGSGTKTGQSYERGRTRRFDRLAELCFIPENCAPSLSVSPKKQHASFCFDVWCWPLQKSKPRRWTSLWQLRFDWSCQDNCLQCEEFGCSGAVWRRRVRCASELSKQNHINDNC